MRAFGSACRRRSPARPCCGSRSVAALALGTDGVLQGVAFVEDDDAVEVSAEPVDYLPDAGDLVAALFGAQRGIGREQNALQSA